MESVCLVDTGTGRVRSSEAVDLVLGKANALRKRIPTKDDRDHSEGASNRIHSRHIQSDYHAESTSSDLHTKVPKIGHHRHGKCPFYHEIDIARPYSCINSLEDIELLVEKSCAP